mmetsp:Transcript_59000/g.173190  ORF Transcript_59000/g.173190 Transcript_59000/m.173190 type:complete len:312 (-) Transcript_59000:848-1783(-)
MACSVRLLTPALATWNRSFSSMKRPGSRERSKCTMRLDASSSTRKNHHSSLFASGKSGACTGPIASVRSTCFRSICTVTVATSPTRISSSSSTLIHALTSISPMWEQKASTSATCEGSNFAAASTSFRCAASRAKNSARVVTGCLPLWHCCTVSSLKCGICRSWELLMSSAWTRQRRKSSIALAVANHSRMQAISIMACVTFIAWHRTASRSARSSSDMRPWRRCICAQTRNWFFMTAGSVKLRFLCSTTWPASFCICSLSVGRVGMTRLSAQAARSSGQAFVRVNSVTYSPRKCSVSISTPLAAKFLVRW